MQQEVLWGLWDGVKSFWETLLLPSEFQGSSPIISVLHVLKGPRHLGRASKQPQVPAWRKERSKGPFVGSSLTSRSRISCYGQAVPMLTAFGACFLLGPLISQPSLCLKSPTVYFEIGSTYCGAHYGPEWGTVLPVSICSSDLVVFSKK